MRRYSKGMAAAIGRYLDAIAALRTRRGSGGDGRIEPIAPIRPITKPQKAEKESGFDREA